jgi:hypothetical protein
MLPRRKALVGYLTWVVVSRVAKRMMRQRAKGVAASVGGKASRRRALIPAAGVLIAGLAAAALAARRRLGGPGA